MSDPRAERKPQRKARGYDYHVAKRNRMTPKDLEDFIPFLVNRVSARLLGAFSQAIADTGLSVPEARALSALLFKGDMRLMALSE
eukprot:gene31833-36506_t